MRKVALIFGITGQTGSYLVEHLLATGDYIIHGVVRRSSNFNTRRIDHVFESVRDNLHYGDIMDPVFVLSIVQRLRPHEIYNLAAQSHVKVSFELPFYTAQVDALGPLNVLEAIRMSELVGKTRFLQANTSEMFGGNEVDYTPAEWSKITKNGMDESTPMFPKSPYGAAKLYAHNLVQIYRDSYRMFACNAISFNHESERRDPRFVTRKVTRTVARMRLGLENKLVLGNLDACRDWGYAKDYAIALHLMLQQDVPRDLVIATGETHSVRELVEVAFEKGWGKRIRWNGRGCQERGMDAETGEILVEVDEKYRRPNEVDYLKGNSQLARKTLDWQPSTKFVDMINMMVTCDLRDECKNNHVVDTVCTSCST